MVIRKLKEDALRVSWMGNKRILKRYSQIKTKGNRSADLSNYPRGDVIYVVNGFNSG